MTKRGICLLNSSYERGNYDELYKRYLKNVAQLVDQIKIQKGKSYVDLCGGTGAVSKELIKRGATDITLVDLHRNMLKQAPSKITKICANAEEWKPKKKYDVIFCRQAITYLNLEKVEKVISIVLKNDGSFIFNIMDTTGKNTTLSVDYKKYELDEKKYTELTFLILGKAYHFQHSNKDGLDFTIFHVYTPKDVEQHFKNWKIKINKTPKALYFILKKQSIL